jgi:hypothetical protein
VKPSSPTKIGFNGASHQPERPLRFVFFGESVVSDWGNPAATTVRAVMRALMAAGHEALFLEERRNRATVELLRARGSAGVRAFAERYGDLHYRTYELPTGLERTVWFVRQVATVDAVVVLDGAPAGVFEEAARLDARHLTRVCWSARGEAPEAAWADLRLSPEGAEAAAGTIICGPAVERTTWSTSDARAGVLVVAYDDQEAAEQAREALGDVDPECLSAGSVSGDDWQFVPEVELPERYGRARAAVVVGAGGDPFARAREMLPLAAGCAVLNEEDRVELPARYEASKGAGRLVEAVRQARLVRLS